MFAINSIENLYVLTVFAGVAIVGLTHYATELFFDKSVLE